MSSMKNNSGRVIKNELGSNVLNCLLRKGYHYHRSSSYNSSHLYLCISIQSGKSNSC